MGLKSGLFVVLFANGLTLWVSLIASWMTGRQFDIEFNKLVFVAFIPVYILGFIISEHKHDTAPTIIMRGN